MSAAEMMIELELVAPTTKTEDLAWFRGVKLLQGIRPGLTFNGSGIGVPVTVCPPCEPEEDELTYIYCIGNRGGFNPIGQWWKALRDIHVKEVLAAGGDGWKERAAERGAWQPLEPYPNKPEHQNPVKPYAETLMKQKDWQGSSFVRADGFVNKVSPLFVFRLDGKGQPEQQRVPTMHLVSKRGLMRCTMCGRERYAQFGKTGRVPRKFTLCPNGCKPKDKEWKHDG